MPTILQLRRGTAAQNAAYTGSVGELTVDTENTILRLHDGSTAGGTAVGSSGITPTFGNVKIGVTAAGEIDTSSGNLTIDSAGGTVTIDDDVTISGSLTVSGTTTTVNSTQVNIQNAFVFEGATADDHETTLTTIDPTADRTIKLPNVSGTIPVLAAESSTQITATPAELNILDGVTATATEINLIDGGTTPGTTAVAGGDGLITNDNGTMQQTTVDTFDTYFAATTKTLTNKTLTSPVINTSVSGSAIKDEDDMSSNSATALATQQSIKAYVDTQLTAEDLDFQADSGGALSIDLDSETMTFTGGTGIDTSGSGNTVTFAIDSTVATLTGSQTLTNKTIALGSNTVSGTTSQFNSALSDGSFATLAGTETLTNKTISGADNTLSNIGNSSLSNSTITVSDGSNTTATALGGTITFAGTTNEVEVSESSGTITVGLPNNVTISGNLTVSGDTTTVNTATLAVEDPLINLATGNNSSDAVDIGFYGLYDTSGSQDLYAGLFRDAGDGKFKLFKDNQAAPTTTVNTSGTGYAVATLVANLEATTATLGGSDIISTDNTKTLTNKTIAAGNNTLSGITSSHFASAVTLVINDSSGSAVKTIVGSAS
tara:strand:+ start:669 stop:2477 length:1809 start_codon:yes stop_codon:yes gene_type:complete